METVSYAIKMCKVKNDIAQTLNMQIMYSVFIIFYWVNIFKRDAGLVKIEVGLKFLKIRDQHGPKDWTLQ